MRLSNCFLSFIFLLLRHSYQRALSHLAHLFQFDTINLGCRVVIFKNIYFLSEDHFYLKSVDPDEMPHMWHFIWVFTVCKSTHLGVSNIQRVKLTVSWFCFPSDWSRLARKDCQDVPEQCCLLATLFQAL